MVTFLICQIGKKKFKSVKTQFLKTKNMYTLWKDSESIHQTYALKKCIV